MLKAFIILLSLFSSVLADCFLHNPRGDFHNCNLISLLLPRLHEGSNNRVEENNVNAAQQNRLFDSQNNGKGGYCKGPAMSYYEGSRLMIEWTQSHGCGVNYKVYCTIILQYMCTDSDAPLSIRVRDGLTTDAISEVTVEALATESTLNSNNNVDPNSLVIGEPVFGMHESLQYYQACTTRFRNRGLWINDRNLNQQSTRQNNGGGRSGFECPEERDYYPYWAPTPWRDVAIFTFDTSFCSFYKKESQNVKSRFYCADRQTGEQAPPNNQVECESLAHEWREVPAFDIPPPDCLKVPDSRDNHMGDGDIPGMASTYEWTLPTAEHESCIARDNCNCVFRFRYNISTDDLGPTANHPKEDFIDWTRNEGNSPVRNNPIVQQDGIPYLLAINTNQFGRTFQDRSHVFHIRPRPEGISKGDRIFNLNVRGKRGNNVQAFPAVEYDFVPNHLSVTKGDYIHFQWTGCDNNPSNNAGEGTAGTDRSNIVQIEGYRFSVPASDEWLRENKALFEDPILRQQMGMAGQKDCLPLEELMELNANDPENCLKLNKGPEHFDGGLVQLNQRGKFYYMSTRNHSFSNRTQKGVIEVNNPVWVLVLIIIGSVFGGLCLCGAIGGGVTAAVLLSRRSPRSPPSNEIPMQTPPPQEEPQARVFEEQPPSYE